MYYSTYMVSWSRVPKTVGPCVSTVPYKTGWGGDHAYEKEILDLASKALVFVSFS